MITEIIKEANLTGAKDQRLPYPLGNAALSKLDSATEEQKKEQNIQGNTNIMTHSLIISMF